MNDRKKPVHAGHRERVREKYRANGLEGFADHEVLELLLFYANKRGNTNPTAHALLDRFGSISSVFEASYDDLLKVGGVGDCAATLITLVPQLFRRYYCDKAERTEYIGNSQDAKEYLAPRFFGLTEEKVGILCMDAQGRINNLVFLSEGSLSLTQVDLRKTAQIALQNNAESVIIAHNHPKGLATPSRSDIETTKKIVDALGMINICVADHIIFADEESFSMASNKKFSPIFLNRFAENPNEMP